MTDGADRLQVLLDELDRERQAFLDGFEAVEPELLLAPGVVEAWSARDLVVHVAFWSEHGAEALELAASERGEAFAYSTAQTDAMNARVTEEAQALSPGAARAREQRAFADFRERLASLDPALLDLRLGNGDTVEGVVRYDGSDHYAEHAAHLAAWFGE